ncbi:MAG TPA: IspD/TarI family cytidylyltransferase [Marmoricola sp.]|nr:IspD/TarI family cytidylyltransferase [Marmoricola sp.]
MGVAAVILAGGSGSRLGAGMNKVFLPLAGVPVLVRSVTTALTVPGVDRVVVVTRPEEHDQVAELLAPHLGEREVWLVAGGAQRHDSEWNALQALATEIDSGMIDLVAIHDGARPLATGALWQEVLESARAHGGAIPVVRTEDLVHRDREPLPESVGAVQTPQAFWATPLLQAHREAARLGQKTTDTAACLEQFGTGDFQITAVRSTPGNLKITWAEDLARAQGLVLNQPPAVAPPPPSAPGWPGQAPS